MIRRFLSDARGGMLAENALILALTFVCLCGAALYLGGKASLAIRKVAEEITGGVVEIAREFRPG